jgi:predicted DCC family thiol-disulfide oxidoreductase YuxK
MKTDHYILVYDDKCPMCAAYTRLFVRTGILSNQGRQSFSTIDTGLFEKFDIERGKDEIPLVDTVSGKVYYGIDSLLELLNSKIPFIKSTGRLKPVYWFLKKLYKFISFNRKVIVAVKCSKGQFDCSPGFNYKWRSIFLLFFLCFNTLSLFPVQMYVLVNSIFNDSTIGYIQLIHALLVSSNIILALTMSRPLAFEYLGQVNMLATIVILFLLILAGFNRFMMVNIVINNLYLLALLVFILKEYKRRMNYIGVFNNKTIVAINIICVIAFLTLLLI